MSRSALIALLSLTCCDAGKANADTVESSLLPWLGIYGSNSHAPLSDPWRAPPMPVIIIAFDDEDLLRRYVDGARTVDLSTRQARMAAILPLPGDVGQWLQVETEAGSGNFAGQGRSRQWSGALATDRSVGGLAYRRDGSRHRLTAGLHPHLLQAELRRLFDAIARRRERGTPPCCRIHLHFREKGDPQSELASVALMSERGAYTALPASVAGPCLLLAEASLQTVEEVPPLARLHYHEAPRGNGAGLWTRGR